MTNLDERTLPDRRIDPTTSEYQSDAHPTELLGPAVSFHVLLATTTFSAFLPFVIIIWFRAFYCWFFFFFFFFFLPTLRQRDLWRFLNKWLICHLCVAWDLLQIKFLLCYVMLCYVMLCQECSGSYKKQAWLRGKQILNPSLNKLFQSIQFFFFFLPKAEFAPKSASNRHFLRNASSPLF